MLGENPEALSNGNLALTEAEPVKSSGEEAPGPVAEVCSSLDQPHEPFYLTMTLCKGFCTSCLVPCEKGDRCECCLKLIAERTKA